MRESKVYNSLSNPCTTVVYKGLGVCITLPPLNVHILETIIANTKYEKDKRKAQSNWKVLSSFMPSKEENSFLLCVLALHAIHIIDVLAPHIILHGKCFPFISILLCKIKRVIKTNLRIAIVINHAENKFSCINLLDR